MRRTGDDHKVGDLVRRPEPAATVVLWLRQRVLLRCRRSFVVVGQRADRSSGCCCCCWRCLCPVGRRAGWGEEASAEKSWSHALAWLE